MRVKDLRRSLTWAGLVILGFQARSSSFAALQALDHRAEGPQLGR